MSATSVSSAGVEDGAEIGGVDIISQKRIVLVKWNLWYVRSHIVQVYILACACEGAEVPYMGRGSWILLNLIRKETCLFKKSATTTVCLASKSYP